jgi:hypothetical protein
MGYCALAGVISGIQFSNTDLVESNPDKFYTTKTTSRPASCNHVEARGNRYCPTCGMKYKKGKPDQTEKIWHLDPCEFVENLTLPDDVSLYQWTDTNTWFHAIGVPLVEMSADECRHEKIVAMEPHEHAMLFEKLCRLELFPEEHTIGFYGTWFIYGGS